jgi:hypothetical protein
MKSESRPRVFGDRVGVVLLLSAIVFAFREVLTAPPWTVDDAFITARYADHLAHAGVFAYNLDGPKVEGITSPLFALVGAFASLGGASPIVAMTVLGIGSYIASAVLVFALARELRLPTIAAGLAVWAYVAIPEHVTHATSGLETEAFMATELASILSLARFWRVPSERHRSSLFGACLTLCFLRPEGLAVTAILVSTAALRFWRRPADRKRLARRAALGIGLPLGVALAARVFYFHALLPNTFYAKRRGPMSVAQLKDIVTLTQDYVLDFLVVGAALCVIAWLLGVRRSRVSVRAGALVLVSLAVVGAFAPAYAYKDVMNYSRRFAMHVLPWLFTVMLVGMSLVSSRVARLGVRRGRVLASSMLGAAAIFVVFLWLPGALFRRRVELEQMSDHVRIRKEWYEPARQLLQVRASTLGHPARLAVYPDAGYVPYRTDFTTIDFGRLNDRHLAREVRSSQEVVDYFFDSSIDAAIFSHYGPDRMWNEDAKAILADPRFVNYKLVKEWRDARRHGISLYIRR